MEKASLVQRGLRVKKRTSFSRKKKRRFCGNQFTKIKTMEQETVSAESNEVPSSSDSANNSSISHFKLEDIPGSTTPKQSDPNICGYRFVDVEILSDIFECVCCPQCKSSELKLHEVFFEKTWICIIISVIV